MQDFLEGDREVWVDLEITSDMSSEDKREQQDYWKRLIFRRQVLWQKHPRKSHGKETGALELIVRNTSEYRASETNKVVSFSEQWIKGNTKSNGNNSTQRTLEP